MTRIRGNAAAGSQLSNEVFAAAGGAEVHRRNAGRRNVGIGIGRPAVTAVRRLGVFALALVALAGCRLITTPEAGEPDVIALFPTLAQVEEGESLRLRVTDATRADSREVTGIPITWETLDPAVATVQDGVVRGVRFGEARIRARLETGKVAETTIEVTRTPAEIALIAGNPQVAEVADVLPSPIEARVVSRAGRPVVGAEVRFHVKKGAGSTSPVVAVADNDGVVRGVWTLGHVAGEQLLELEVRNANGISVEARAEARPGPAQEVVVEPSQVTLKEGASVPLSSMVTDRYGNVLGEYTAVWSSSNPVVARVSESGVVTGVTRGQTTVEAVPVQEGPSAAPASVLAQLAASPGRGRGNSQVQVSDGDGESGDDGVGSVSITGGDNQSGIVGTQLGRELEVRILDSSGTPVRQFDVSWVVVSGNGQTSAATVRTNGQGRASVSWTLGPVAGEQVVEARAGSHGTATFTATAVAGAVDVVEVSPGSAEVKVGGSRTFTARAMDRYGNEVTGKSVAWSVENTSVAAVSSNGSAEGIQAGGTRVVASVEGVKGTADLAVVEQEQNGGDGPGDGAGVQVTPDSAVVHLGESIALSATVLDASGSVVSDAGLEWSSLHPDIASVNSEGVVLSKAVGTALIVVAAACCDVADTAMVQVAGSPGTVEDLQTVSTTDASVTLRWTQVDDGAGNPARYAVRFDSPEVSWWLAADSETSVDGDEIGSTMEVELNGMASDTKYEFQLVAYRGELNNGAKFGDLSNKDGTRTLASSEDGGSGGGGDDGSSGGGDEDQVVGSAERPNEPAGFEPWFEHDWQTFPTCRSSGCDMPASGAGWFKAFGTNSNLSTATLVEDSAAPHGKGRSVRILAPEGHPIGSGFFSLSLRSSDVGGVSEAQDAATKLQKWYISYWIQFEPNPIDGRWDIRTHQLRQFTVNRQIVGVPSLFGYTFRWPGAFGPSNGWGPHRMWGRDSPTSGTVDHFNQSPGPSVGRWHHIEMVFDRTVKSPPLFAEGEDGVGPMAVSLWMDGVLIRDEFVSDFYADKPFMELFLNFNPSGGETFQRDEFIRIGDVYVSGERYQP